MPWFIAFINDNKNPEIIHYEQTKTFLEILSQHSVLPYNARERNDFRIFIAYFENETKIKRIVETQIRWSLFEIFNVLQKHSVGLYTISIIDKEGNFLDQRKPKDENGRGKKILAEYQ